MKGEHMSLDAKVRIILCQRKEMRIFLCFLTKKAGKRKKMITFAAL